MTARRRGPSAAEQALWRFAMRDAVPLPGRELPPEPPAAPEPAALEKTAPEPPRHRSRPTAQPIVLPRLSTASAPGLDGRSAERLKRGQLTIEGRLDLHGMTQEDARAALDRFIGEAYATGKRALLIITGKGLKPREPTHPWDHSAGGVLKAMTPRWLNEVPNRARILAITEAQPRHGGSGALYVLIRRQRGRENQ